jgi:hypothetical protein
MSIEDEKTRPARRAVKRKEATPVTEQATRQVTAVTRKRTEALPEERLVTPFRVHVLPRGELLNAAGSSDNGWVVRDDYEDTECLRFVLCDEGLAATVKRTLLSGGKYALDLMDGAQCRGGLVLDSVEAEGVGQNKRAPGEGSGHLYDGAGGRLAGFVVRPKYEVICLGADSKLLFETAKTPEGARVMARKRTIAVLSPLASDGLLSRYLGTEISFEKSASPFERLCVVAGVTLHDAWSLERKRFGVGTSGGRFELDLGALFGLD